MQQMIDVACCNREQHHHKCKGCAVDTAVDMDMAEEDSEADLVDPEVPEDLADGDGEVLLDGVGEGLGGGLQLFLLLL
jgi:hypothetical protein